MISEEKEEEFAHKTRELLEKFDRKIETGCECIDARDITREAAIVCSCVVRRQEDDIDFVDKILYSDSEITIAVRGMETLSLFWVKFKI